MPAVSVTAICVNGHKWKATQEVKRKTMGECVEWTRVVTPSNCSTCGEKWNGVHAKEGKRLRPLRS